MDAKLVVESAEIAIDGRIDAATRALDIQAGEYPQYDVKLQLTDWSSEGAQGHSSAPVPAYRPQTHSLATEERH